MAYEEGLSVFLCVGPQHGGQRSRVKRSPKRTVRWGIVVRHSNESPQRAPATRAMAKWGADGQWLKELLYEPGTSTLPWPGPV